MKESKGRTAKEREQRKESKGKQTNKTKHIQNGHERNQLKESK